MCSFSGATCTSRVRHNADYVPYAKIRFDLLMGSTSESRQPLNRPFPRSMRSQGKRPGCGSRQTGAVFEA